MWRRTLDQLGLQSAQSDQSQQRRRAAAGLVARAGARASGRHAARARRRDVSCRIPRDVIQAIDAATGDLIWEYKRELPDDLDEVPSRARHQPQPRDLRQPDHRHQRRRLRLRARCADRASWPGRRRSSTTAERRAADLRPDHRATARSFPGRGCESEGGPEACVITAHDAKTGQGTLAHAHDSEARRAGQRNLGRHSLRAALARRHVDGAELRSRAESDVHRHVGDVAGAEVHARRQRQDSTSITTRRSR